MKFVIGSVATLTDVLFMCSMASANPALLPKHEGYPMKNDGRPVNGQPTANDPGQKAGGGESTLLKSADSSSKHAEQKLVDATRRLDFLVTESPAVVFTYELRPQPRLNYTSLKNTRR